MDAAATEWHVEYHVVDGLCAFIEGDNAAARTALLRAEAAPHDPKGLAACFCILLGTYITNHITDYHERIRLMQIAAEQLEQLEFIHAAIDARITQATLRLRYLDGDGALNSLDFALASLKRCGYGAAPEVHFYRGEALYLLDRTSEARTEFEESLHAGAVVGAQLAQTYLARVMLQLCDLAARAHVPVDEAEDVRGWSEALRYYMPAQYGAIGWMRIVRDQRRGMAHRCMLTASDLAVLPNQLNADTPAWVTLCMLAGALFTDHDLQSLEPHFGAAITWFEQTAYHASALRARILQAMLQSRLDKVDDAQRTLQRVLADVERSRLHRMILDFPALEPLLRTAGSPFARSLAARMRTEAPPEALTERELEVLHLFESKLIGKEIAAALSISTGTLHVHTRNIFRKLGVHSRAQAARAARDAGLRAERGQ
jgi:DNA-binding NarL/FixJ family response regulator